MDDQILTFYLPLLILFINAPFITALLIAVFWFNNRIAPEPSSDEEEEHTIKRVMPILNIIFDLLLSPSDTIRGNMTIFQTTSIDISPSDASIAEKAISSLLEEKFAASHYQFNVTCLSEEAGESTQQDGHKFVLIIDNKPISAYFLLFHSTTHNGGHILLP